MPATVQVPKIYKTVCSTTPAALRNNIFLDNAIKQATAIKRINPISPATQKMIDSQSRLLKTVKRLK